MHERSHSAPSQTPPAPPDNLVALMYKELSELRAKISEMETREKQAATAQLNVGALPELDEVMSVPIEQRAEKLIEVLSKLTPEQRAAREAAIFAAYASLPSDPEPTAELRPGTYVVEGKDAHGAPVYGKVKYTKQWLEANYEMVEMFVDVDPRGAIQLAEARYDVQVGQIYKVPSIIRDLYEQFKQNLKVIAWRYQPLTMEESWGSAQKAIETGHRQWVRVHRAGWGMMAPEAFPNVEAPAETQA